MTQTYNGATVDKDGPKVNKQQLAIPNFQSLLAKEISVVGLSDNVPVRYAIPGDELFKDHSTKMEWLVENFIPREGVGALAGTSDIGKSLQARQLCLQIASSDNSTQTYMGQKITPQHHKALLIYTEDSRSAVADGLRKQLRILKEAHVENIRFLFDYDDLLKKIKAELLSEPVDIVVADCFADVFRGDLKDTQQIRGFLSQYQRLAEEHKCFILFIHHTGKRTENLEPSKNNLLSGQGFESKMRLVMEFRVDPMTQRQGTFCIVKGNYLPDAMKQESFVAVRPGDTNLFI